MKTTFSPTWNSSTQPRKQRKFRHNAPLHIRRKFLSANLAKDLRKELGTRSVEIVKGDTVKVLRGDFKGQKGLVERTDTSKLKVFVKDVKRKKINGTEVLVPLEPSNLQIVDINLKDEKRSKNLKKKKQAEKTSGKIEKK